MNTDSITLSDVLNIIDGVLETPGRILILTSNYPDKLDSALLRPGRIDLKIDFKRCDSHQLKLMFTHFYGHDPEFDYDALDDVHVPAYVQEIFLRHLSDPHAAYSQLALGAPQPLQPPQPSQPQQPSQPWSENVVDNDVNVYGLYDMPTRLFTSAKYASPRHTTTLLDDIMDNPERINVMDGIDVLDCD